MIRPDDVRGSPDPRTHINLDMQGAHVAGKSSSSAGAGQHAYANSPTSNLHDFTFSFLYLGRLCFSPRWFLELVDTGPLPKCCPCEPAHEELQGTVEGDKFLSTVAASNGIRSNLFGAV